MNAYHLLRIGCDPLSGIWIHSQAALSVSEHICILMRLWRSYMVFSKYMRSCRGDRTKTGATSVLPLLGLTSKTRQFDRTQFCLDDGREIEMHLITMLLVPILTS